nr:cytochrome b [Bathymodiolus septemdierum]
MFGPLRKRDSVVKILNSSLYDLPAPVNLSVLWNFGSLLGLCLVIQIVTGFVLSLHYTAHVNMSFDSVIHVVRDVNNGWLFRAMHANGASLFFVCAYFHIGRGLYYGSYKARMVWNVGVILLFLLMATAFLGYVLPWGQMSYWGATVITKLVTAVPYVGEMLLYWIWGGYTVCNATLVRFYSFHFILPFVMIVFSVVHLFYLHEEGANNPLGVSADSLLVRFHPFYTYKDVVGFFILFFGLLLLVCFWPDLLGNVNNWVPADPMKTPLQIEPEWYFLFAYSILRSIPNKSGGAAALVVSVLILFVIPSLHTGQFRSNSFYPLGQFSFWGLIVVWTGLTWIGACPVQDPYDLLGCVFTFLYFFFIMLIPLSQGLWDWLIK